MRGKSSAPAKTAGKLAVVALGAVLVEAGEARSFERA